MYNLHTNINLKSNSKRKYNFYFDELITFVGWCKEDAFTDACTAVRHRRHMYNKIAGAYSPI